MKFLSIAALAFIMSIPLSSQNITNTLGNTGSFKIKDAGTTFLNVRQSDGQIDFYYNIKLNNTSTSTTGIIYKGNNSFIHDFEGTNSNGGNTFIGSKSGNFTMTGSSYNTGVGQSTLNSLTTGDRNTATGFISMLWTTTGQDNSAYGSGTLFLNTTGSFNCAYGVGTLYNNISGSSNNGFGHSTLNYNTSGEKNSAFGTNALFLNTTGNENCAFGNVSLLNNRTGDFNSAYGNYSLNKNTTGYSNTSIGHNSLKENTVGAGNTAIGVNSLMNNTTGILNTVIGYQSGTVITTGSNLTLIGYNAEPLSVNVSNQITLGNNQVVALRCNVTSISSLSDARDKKNIIDLPLGLDFIAMLKPRMYNWDKREWYEDKISDGSKMQQVPTAGFIAQELDEAQTNGNAEWLNLVLKDNPEKWEATPGNLLPIVVKAIQELKANNDELAESNNKLEKENSLLEQKLMQFEEQLAKYEEAQLKLIMEIQKLKSSEEKVNEVKLGEK